jgi:hypothetical protein
LPKVPWMTHLRVASMGLQWRPEGEKSCAGGLDFSCPGGACH